MARDNGIIAREKIHPTSAEKRIEIDYLRKVTNFKEFTEYSGLDVKFLESAIILNTSNRRTWRKRKRQEFGVFRKKHDKYNKNKLDSFQEIESELWKKFQILSQKKEIDNPHYLEKCLNILREFYEKIPGSGYAPKVIRFIARNFFSEEKESREKVPACTTDHRQATPRGDDFAKIK